MYIKYLAIISLFFGFFSCKKESTDLLNTIDSKVDSVLSLMTIDEKIGQLTLYAGDMNPTGPLNPKEYEDEIKDGKVGAVLNIYGADEVKRIQDLAVSNTRLRIPLIFGYDVIHGFKTIFPIPLAEACSWDLQLIEKTARLSAKEATAAGLNWTFSPMVDIVRDPRWGRVAEGAGEDTYLSSLISFAKVKGYQGDNLRNPNTMAACVKHYAAYGAPYGGRDYNTVDVSDRVLRETYLPPYRAAVDAGVSTVMSSFNEIDGIPSTGNYYLLTQILRNEWGFKGFVVSDWTSVNEMVNHGYAADEKQAGEIALNAGLEMDMQGSVFSKYLKKSLAEGIITESKIDKAVKNILHLKFELGLFDNPDLYINGAREREVTLSNELMEHALLSAKKSIVLLKNDNCNGAKLLPLNKNIKRIALIGPLGNVKTHLLGSWHGVGDTSKVVTVLEGLKEKFPNSLIEFAEGAGFNDNSNLGFSHAINIGSKADLIICSIGENCDQSGEASSRSDFGLPGAQLSLVQELVKTGKPVIAIVMAGRPLTIEWLAENIPAIIYAGHLGTRTGDAIAEVLSGDFNPSGKLVISFPRSAGQIPVFYNHKNTGRPFDEENKYTSKYLDISNEPLYPFGYGLSYTTFEYSNLNLDKPSIKDNDTLIISFTLKNSGTFDGEETVQLYLRDMVGSVTRPVKELKGFKKVFLKSGEQKVITFSITEENLKFYDKDMRFVAEPGLFKVFVGGSSDDLISADFNLIKN